MKKIAVIGPESSGGRYVSRCLSASKMLDVQHWSMPYGPSRGDRFWPHHRNFNGEDFTDAVVTVRNWDPMVLSATKEHTNSLVQAEAEARRALLYTIRWLEGHGVRWRVVTYESLSNPSAMQSLFEWFGVEPVEIEEFKDGNEKWYDLG